MIRSSSIIRSIIALVLILGFVIANVQDGIEWFVVHRKCAILERDVEECNKQCKRLSTRIHGLKVSDPRVVLTIAQEQGLDLSQVLPGASLEYVW